MIRTRDLRRQPHTRAAFSGSAGLRPTPEMQPRTRAGFSLAEVMLAMAIASFALLALIAVLPEGLELLRDAEKRAAEARIVQDVTARYQMLDWATADMDNSSEEEFEFDVSGNPLDQAGDRDRVVYKARVKIEPAKSLPNEGSPSPFLRRLRIRITDRWQSSSAFSNAQLYRERYTVLADFDRTPGLVSPQPQEQSPGSTSSPSSGSSLNP